MKKLLHYAKPYVLPILICVVLLFVQAACDLNLLNPDIDNIGHQIRQIQIACRLPRRK